MQSGPIDGGCFCGAIRYRADASPLGSMICHCRSCRRLAGSPVVAWVTFLRAQFRFVAGTPREFPSSEGVRRTFCPSCGSPLTYEGTKFPDEVDVTTCTLDHPEDAPPSHHSWTGHDLPWVRFGDGLPMYPETKMSGSDGGTGA